MTTEHFEETLRQFIRQEPFQPFVVELINGRVIEVNYPQLVFAGGAASFFTPAYDFVEFTCEETREIHQKVPGAAS